MSPSLLISIVGLIVAPMIMAGGFVVGRQYLEIGGTVWDVVALRYGVAGMVLLPVLVLPGRWPGIDRALIIAITGGALFGILIFIGVSGAPIAHGAALAPGIGFLLASVLGVVVLREPFGPARMAGMALTLGGLAMIVGPSLVGSGAGHPLSELAYIGAGVIWGVLAFVLRRWRIDPLTGAAIAAALSLVYLVPYWFALAPQIPVLPVGETLWQGFYQGILFQGVAIFLFARAVGRFGAVAGASVMPLVPAWGALFEGLVFGEWMGPAGFAGLAAMAIGIVLIAYGGMAGRRQEAAAV